MGDGVIEAHLDQPFANGERYQALRRLARDAELAGDLVLGVAGDVIEPAGAGRVVQTAAFVSLLLAMIACCRPVVFSNEAPFQRIASICQKR
jgi:hypothetical protein